MIINLFMRCNYSIPSSRLPLSRQEDDQLLRSFPASMILYANCQLMQPPEVSRIRPNLAFPSSELHPQSHRLILEVSKALHRQNRKPRVDALILIVVQVVRTLTLASLLRTMRMLVSIPNLGTTIPALSTFFTLVPWTGTYYR